MTAEEPRPGGPVVFASYSDSEVTRGLAALLVRGLVGLSADRIAALDPGGDRLRRFLAALGLGTVTLAPSRANGVLNVLEAMRKRARLAMQGELESAQAADARGYFPSLLVTAGGGIAAEGAFAAAQAAYLAPDRGAVATLADALAEARMGVVAHFYMDPEVQGVLAAAAEVWPHVHISDSLAMADAAVRMAQAGCQRIAVLGVDFMSDNVRAILDASGYPSVHVHRMAAAPIGCSLAEAADAPAYGDWLRRASATPRSLHVVYINTSLATKALAGRLLPTITCTSSNVVQTVLAAAAQIPGVNIWYGPDSYMGANLEALLGALAGGDSDDAVRALHPAHDRASVTALLPRLRHYESGSCVVHDLFGRDVTDAVASRYGDAHLAAHFEVPGEMFALALAAAKRGMGVVGSTSNILDYIRGAVGAALGRGFPERVQVILGTEAGMVTAIVRAVHAQLDAAPAESAARVALELVFPVSPEAIARTDAPLPPAGTTPAVVPSLQSMAVVPGVAGGEGCSLAGGCASCPYMKMNTLAALRTVCRLAASPGTDAAQQLSRYAPKIYPPLPGGGSIAIDGCASILHMRHFQASGQLSPVLVAQILAHGGGGI